MHIGKIIQELRINSKITQAELAKKSGINFTTISKIEKGSLTGTLTTHQKIAKALGLSVSELCQGLEETTKPAVEINQAKAALTDTFYYDEKATSQILVKHLARRKMVPELLHLDKGGMTHLEQKPRGTEQFIFVHEGNIEVRIGDVSHQLKKGGSVYFDASLPHTVKNISTGSAKVLRISSPSTL